jgi:hypothetical protein
VIGGHKGLIAMGWIKKVPATKPTAFVPFARPSFPMLDHHPTMGSEVARQHHHYSLFCRWRFFRRSLRKCAADSALSRQPVLSDPDAIASDLMTKPISHHRVARLVIGDGN